MAWAEDAVSVEERCMAVCVWLGFGKGAAAGLMCGSVGLSHVVSETGENVWGMSHAAWQCGSDECTFDWVLAGMCAFPACATQVQSCLQAPSRKIGGAGLYL